MKYMAQRAFSCVTWARAKVTHQARFIHVDAYDRGRGAGGLPGLLPSHIFRDPKLPRQEIRKTWLEAGPPSAFSPSAPQLYVLCPRGNRTLARAWRGHGACVARAIGNFWLGVVRAWRGRGADMSCSPRGSQNRGGVGVEG
eukprot:gene10228-biopygen22796